MIVINPQRTLINVMGKDSLKWKEGRKIEAPGFFDTFETCSRPVWFNYVTQNNRECENNLFFMHFDNNSCRDK